MIVIKISDLVKNRRKELGMTQEQLCEGICEPVTISRLENGKQIPSQKHLQEIFERLNIPNEYLAACFLDDSYRHMSEKEEILKEIYHCFMLPKKQQIKKLEDIKSDTDKRYKNGNISEQFYCFIDIFVNLNNSSIEDNMKKCIFEIQKTNPCFDISKISELLFTNDEFYLTLLLGVLFYMKSDNEQCEAVFLDLMNYMKKRKNYEIINENNKIRDIFVHVLYMRVLKHMKKYIDAVVIGENILCRCLDEFQYFFLGIVYETLADCKKEMNDSTAYEYYRKAWAYYFSTNNQCGLERLEIKNIKLSQDDMFFNKQKSKI